MNAILKDILFVALLAVPVGIFVFIYLRQRKQIQLIKEECDEIEGEEHRMFDFLHVLGAALQYDNSEAEMHRMIVEGVMEVVQADGGALYLVDKEKTTLTPTYISENCAPVVTIPDEVLKESTSGTRSRESFLRLTSVSTDSGLLGQCFTEKKGLNLKDMSQHDLFKNSKLSYYKNASLMISPLAYGENAIGVITVNNPLSKKPFSTNDYDVFRSLSEQSAFALGNALMHKEVAEKKKLESDLKTASEIQKILLPSRSPELIDYTIVGRNFPAKMVSGDYYDYIKIDETGHGVVIADVSGKGVPASLIMAMCRSVLRFNAQESHSPSDVLSKVNRSVFRDIREDMFITMAYLILEKYSNQITLSRAGHDPPLHYLKEENRIERLQPPGMAIGIDSGEVFERVTQDFTVEMKSGDCLLLYTDGVNEALNSQGDEFGVERIEETLLDSASQGPEQIIQHITDRVKDFVGDASQSDDITLLALVRK